MPENRINLLTGEPIPPKTSSVQPHPDCTPKQLAAIEKYKQEHPGIDPTPIVNLIMKMRENPALEKALMLAAQNMEKQTEPAGDQKTPPSQPTASHKGCQESEPKTAPGLSESSRGHLRKRKIKHVKLQFRAGTGTTFRG